MPRAKRLPKAAAPPIDRYVIKLLEKISKGKKLITFPKGETVFSQGDKADAIYFIESGKVKIAVLSSMGKEAVIAMLGPHDFLGEGALVGQTLRVSTAKVIEASVVYRIEKSAMTRALFEQPTLAEKFIAALLTRNIDLEEDLCDQLFNHTEKRLARVLLKLSRLQGHDSALDAQLPMMSHETLAEMVGTTRSHITRFMNKFRKLGLIDYNGSLTVRTELLTDLVLHD